MQVPELLSIFKHFEQVEQLAALPVWLALSKAISKLP
jgi:hypothetical protein